MKLWTSCNNSIEFYGNNKILHMIEKCFSSDVDTNNKRFKFEEYIFLKSSHK